MHGRTCSAVKLPPPSAAEQAANASTTGPHCRAAMDSGSSGGRGTRYSRIRTPMASRLGDGRTIAEASGVVWLGVGDGGWVGGAVWWWVD